MKVAVILGNRLNDDASFSEAMKTRLTLALKLVKEMSPDKLIVSGGIANKAAGVAEGDAMRSWLLEQGIDEDLVISENKSKTTKENAAFSVPILKALNADTLILCTSKEHFDRPWLNPYKLFKRALRGTAINIIKYTND
jgi:Uncharacterized conserved protein